MNADPAFDLSPAAACVDEALSRVSVLDGVVLDGALRAAEILARRTAALRSAVIARSIEVERHKDDGHRRPGGSMILGRVRVVG